MNASLRTYNLNLKRYYFDWLFYLYKKKTRRFLNFLSITIHFEAGLIKLLQLSVTCETPKHVQYL